MTLRRIVTLAFAAGLTIAAALAINQRTFADSYFLFGTVRDYEGVIEMAPIPHLAASSRIWPLVARGKFGFHGTPGRASLRGTPLGSGPIEMLEIEPGSVRALGNSAAARPEPFRLVGHTTLAGELVDSKCHLGVMNPGAGVTHLACARRCLSGGVTPGLRATGGEFYFLRTESNLSEEAGRRVEVSGDLLAAGPVRTLVIESLRRLE